jgi:starvation-inducible DNA-binding protein
MMTQTAAIRTSKAGTELRREGIHEIAEGARGIDAATLHSIGDIARCRRLKDNDRENVGPHAMLAELHDDNAQLTCFLRGAHEVCANNNDVATTSLIEVRIDRTGRRTWFLAETINESRER